MSDFTITPNLIKKTARFSGVVAAGEHATVRIVGASSLLATGLRLRAVWMCKTIAVFPIPDSGDAFSTSENDLVCTLNLNTVQVIKAFRRAPELDVLFVLDNPVAHKLHFSSSALVRGWPQEPADIPVNLDNYADFVADTTSAIEALQSGVADNAAAIAGEVAARSAMDETMHSEVTLNAQRINSLLDGTYVKSKVEELFHEKNYDLSTTDGFVEAFIDVVKTLGGNTHE